MDLSRASIVQLNANTLWAFTLASNAGKILKILPCARGRGFGIIPTVSPNGVQ